MIPKAPEAATPSTSDATGDASTRPTLTRGTSIGRYLILDPVGEGGMGVVYKAYDPKLDRLVALKVMRTLDEGDGQRGRLLREAQALAQLSHPNVIAVHDVGTFGDDVFIAMELVGGLTVRQWLKAQPRTQCEILDVFVAAGEGLAAAHRAGLVHRDFKPGNVMVGDDGRVRVLDFGLARAAGPSSPRIDRAGSYDSGPTVTPNEEMATVGGRGNLKRRRPAQSRAEPDASASSAPATSPSAPLLVSPVTVAGAVVGTPRFMAPEQYLGEPISEATDEFSFCVSLYWALYGDFPFVGGDDDSLDSILTGKISQPRADSSVPRWLRQVLLAGLAVDPADRHPSMDALLSALRADPRAARMRLLRIAPLVVGAAALASTAVAGGLAYKAHRAVVEQARVGQQFGQEAEQIATLGRDAASLPLHDTRGAMDAIRARMRALEGQMRALGPLAVGPGHEALGRGYLALEQYDDALRQLEAAYATGYRSAELAYALGMAHGKLYQRALAELPKTKDEKLDAARRAVIARAHRDPALRYLREARTFEGGVDTPEYVEGLIALYEQRFTDALALAQKAAERALWPYEARTLEGDIHVLGGKERYRKGDVDGALAEYEHAGSAYRAAAEVARSGFAAYAGDCRRLAETTLIETDRDKSPEATVKRALAACGDATATRSDLATPLVDTATSWRNLADYQRRHGVDPTVATQEVIHLGERALALDPRDVRAHQVIGEAYNCLAEYRMSRAADPRLLLEQTIAHGKRGLEIAPDYYGYRLVAFAYITQGAYEQMRGIDPRGSYRASILFGENALQVSPGGFEGWNGLGLSELNLAEWEMTHGHDPTRAYTAASEAYGKVVQISPTLDYGHINLCALYQSWAEYDILRGVDPRPRLAKATESCVEAIRLDGNYDGSHFYLGLSNTTLAAWQLEHGIDPADAIARSRAELERSLAINPGDPEALMFLGESRTVEGRSLSAGGRDPLPVFAVAEANARKALAQSGGQSPDALRILTDLYRWRAEWRGRRHLPVANDVREGLALAERTLVQAPDQAPVEVAAAALHLVSARGRASSSERVAAAERARTALKKALDLDANLDREVQPMLDEAARLAVP